MKLRVFLHNKYESVFSDSRTGSIIKNISVGFVAKSLSILLSIFFQIPITLSVLSKTEYGIWLTLFSISSWLVYFDFGLGHGLRNKLTEALAEGDLKKGKLIVSTTYRSFFIIFFSIIILFSLVASWLPWGKILNTSLIPQNDMLILVYFSFICSLLNFIANLINTVLAANHLSRISDFLLLTTQIVILLAIIFIKYSPLDNKLIPFGILLSLAPLIINVLASVYFFQKKFKKISPSINLFDKAYLRDVFSVSIKFFVIQMTMLIIFGTDNILITQLYSSAEVTTYNIVYRYLSVIPIAFGIITIPLWTMYTDAFKKKDILWVDKTIKRLLKLFILASIFILTMVFLCNWVLKIWLNSAFAPSIIFVFFLAIYNLQLIWNNIFIIPLNAIGKLNLQMGFAIFAAIINIPLVLFLSNYIESILSVVIANILSLLFSSIAVTCQYYLVLSKAKNEHKNHFNMSI